jgi:hypothetical protein
LVYYSDTSEEECKHCAEHTRFEFKEYPFTVKGFFDFSNDYKIPLILEANFPFNNEINIFYFSKDKSIIKKLLFFSAPAYVKVEEYILDDYINFKYSQESLLKWKESHANL